MGKPNQAMRDAHNIIAGFLVVNGDQDLLLSTAGKDWLANHAVDSSDKPASDLADKFKVIVSSLETGQLPETRETVSDCLVMVLLKTVEEYVSADSELSQELGILLKALRNKKDPMVREMGTMNHFGLMQIVKQLENIREQIHVKASQDRKDSDNGNPGSPAKEGDIPR